MSDEVHDRFTYGAAVASPGVLALRTDAGGLERADVDAAPRRLGLLPRAGLLAPEEDAARGDVALDR